jgi:hypothetical protein
MVWGWMQMDSILLDEAIDYLNLRGQKALPHSLIKKEFRGLTNRY